MPPKLAALLTGVFIAYLFRRDFRERPNVSSALWIPYIWMFIIGSRPVSHWLGILGMPVGSSTAEEGSPIDALAYFALIAAGLYVLNKRQINLSEVFRNNGWLLVFVLYCFISIFWSDYPLVAFKRWIKILGHPVMVLILLTETDPEEALARLIKRSAYVLIPGSILFLKYYPEWGRAFDEWTGLATNNGITEGKNALGRECLVLGFFFFWNLLNTYRAQKSDARRAELRLTMVFLVMIGWLFSKAHSATSLLSLLIGLLVMVLLGFRIVNKRRVGAYALLVVASLVVGELTFGIFERVVDISGHESTIMGRGQLWGELLAMHTNPIFGVGFESFWMGAREQALWELHWWHPDEAHNGYLEIYLCLGSLGLFLLLAWIVSTFRNIRAELLTSFEFGRFRMGLFVAIILNNWTESAFKGLSLLLFVFYIIAMKYPLRSYLMETQISEVMDEDVEGFTFAPEPTGGPRYSGLAAESVHSNPENMNVGQQRSDQYFNASHKM